MLPKIDPLQTQSRQKLEKHFTDMRDVRMKDLFAEDPDRFNRFHVRFNEILVDYSKNRITDETLDLLFELAREAGVPQAVASMFSGEKINETENRTVLHLALRNRSNAPIIVDGRDHGANPPLRDHARLGLVP